MPEPLVRPPKGCLWSLAFGDRDEPYLTLRRRVLGVLSVELYRVRLAGTDQNSLSEAMLELSRRTE